MRIAVLVVVVLALATTTEAFAVSSPTMEMVRNQTYTNRTFGLSEFDPVKIDDYLFALLDGLHAAEYVKDSLECIKSTETAVNEIFFAIQYLIKLGPGPLTVLNSTKALTFVDPFIKVCYGASWTAITKVIDHFSQFDGVTAFFSKFFTNAISRIFNFQQIVAVMTDSINSGEYENVFKQVGKIIRIALDFEPDEIRQFEHTMNDDDEEDERDHEKDNALGRIFHFFVEFIKAIKVVETQPGSEALCLSSFENLDDFVENVPKYVLTENYKEAVFSVADVFGGVYPVVDSCYKTAAEVAEEAIKYSHIYSSAWALMMNVVYHFGEMFDSISQMFTCFGTYDGAGAGKALGDFVRMLFFS